MAQFKKALPAGGAFFSPGTEPFLWGSSWNDVSPGIREDRFFEDLE
jgi:hypothetical protein